MIFDLTREKTFDVVKKFYADLRENADKNCIGFLVGNKLDLVSINKPSCGVNAKAFADQNSLKYLEISARLGSSVTEALEILVKGIIKLINYFKKSINVH